MLRNPLALKFLPRSARASSWAATNALAPIVERAKRMPGFHVPSSAPSSGCSSRSNSSACPALAELFSCPRAELLEMWTRCHVETSSRLVGDTLEEYCRSDRYDSAYTAWSVPSATSNSGCIATIAAKYGAGFLSQVTSVSESSTLTSSVSRAASPLHLNVQRCSPF